MSSNPMLSELSLALSNRQKALESFYAQEMETDFIDESKSVQDVNNDNENIANISHNSNSSSLDSLPLVSSIDSHNPKPPPPSIPLLNLTSPISSISNKENNLSSTTTTTTSISADNSMKNDINNNNNYHPGKLTSPTFGGRGKSKKVSRHESITSSTSTSTSTSILFKSTTIQHENNDLHYSNSNSQPHSQPHSNVHNYPSVIDEMFSTHLKHEQKQKQEQQEQQLSVDSDSDPDEDHTTINTDDPFSMAAFMDPSRSDQGGLLTSWPAEDDALKTALESNQRFIRPVTPPRSLRDAVALKPVKDQSRKEREARKTAARDKSQVWFRSLLTDQKSKLRPTTSIEKTTTTVIDKPHPSGISHLLSSTQKMRMELARKMARAVAATATPLEPINTNYAKPNTSPNKTSSSTATTTSSSSSSTTTITTHRTKPTTTPISDPTTITTTTTTTTTTPELPTAGSPFIPLPKKALGSKISALVASLANSSSDETILKPSISHKAEKAPPPRSRASTTSRASTSSTFSITPTSTSTSTSPSFGSSAFRYSFPPPQLSLEEIDTESDIDEADDISSTLSSARTHSPSTSSPSTPKTAPTTPKTPSSISQPKSPIYSPLASSPTAVYQPSYLRKNSPRSQYKRFGSVTLPTSPVKTYADTSKSFTLTPPRTQDFNTVNLSEIRKNLKSVNRRKTAPAAIPSLEELKAKKVRKSNPSIELEVESKEEETIQVEQEIHQVEEEEVALQIRPRPKSFDAILPPSRNHPGRPTSPKARSKRSSFQGSRHPDYSDTIIQFKLSEPETETVVTSMEEADSGVVVSLEEPIVDLEEPIVDLEEPIVDLEEPIVDLEEPIVNIELFISVLPSNGKVLIEFDREPILPLDNNNNNNNNIDEDSHSNSNSNCNDDNQEEEEEEINWNSLPDEMLLDILWFLDADHKSLMAQTCRKWQALANDSLLWQQECLDRWRVTHPELYENDWKKMYYSRLHLEKFWSTTTCQITMLRGHTLGITAVDLESTYDIVVSGSRDSNVVVWNAAESGSMPQLQTLTSHLTPIKDIHIDSSKIVTASAEPSIVKIWTPSLSSSTTLSTSTTSTTSSEPSTTSISSRKARRQRYLDAIAARNEASPPIWSESQSMILSSIFPHEIRRWDTLNNIDINPIRTTQLTVAGSVTGNLPAVLVMDIEHQLPVHSFLHDQFPQPHEGLGSTTRVQSDPTNSSIIWSMTSSGLYQTDLRTGKTDSIVISSPSTLNTIFKSFQFDSSRLVTSSLTSNTHKPLHVFDRRSLDTGALASLSSAVPSASGGTTSTSPITSFKFESDRLVAGTLNGNVTVFTGTDFSSDSFQLHSLGCHNDKIESLAFHDSRLITGSSDLCTLVWDFGKQVDISDYDFSEYLKPSQLVYDTGESEETKNRSKRSKFLSCFKR